MIRSLRLVLLSCVGGCFPFVPATCNGAGPAADVGQFGGYAGPFKYIRLPDGDTLTVYRVKTWTFGNGAPQALQMEYQTRVSIADTVAIRAETLRLWRVFLPYVVRAGESVAILTATDRQVKGGSAGHFTTMRHFGTIIAKDSTGAWRIAKEGTILPAVADSVSQDPKGTGIFERNGQPLMPR